MGLHTPRSTSSWRRISGSEEDPPSHAQAASKLVVNEVRDVALTVSKKPPLAVEVTRDHRAGPGRCQHIALGSRATDQLVAFSGDRDDQVRPPLETVLAYVLVEDSLSHLLEEPARRRSGGKSTAHGGRQVTPDQQPCGMYTFADRSGLQPKKAPDLPLGMSEVIKEDRDLAFLIRQAADGRCD